jgi:hypothetical protein
MQQVGFWTKVEGTVWILGRGLGQGFKVSRFQGFKVSRFQGFKVSEFQGFRDLRSSRVQA